ncbi:MAG: protein kinase domain-containing protein [Gemmatimonadaceae bacterium]
MTTDLRDQLQDTLGDAYTLEREIVGGGMSRLFLATEHSLKRQVVVKVLPREATSEASATRFRREIELAAQLQHPHVLPIYAAGTKGGLLYYIMPYVPGESLRQRLERERPLALADALHILREVADALAYAHHCGVIHRDVKPANVLLAQGHALLADFGVARAIAGTLSGDGVTGEGFTVGTPGYMAPEQAAGEPRLDARADVYALAVVGYEMLAGSPPFGGGTPRALLTAHLTTPPVPLGEIRPDVPRAVADAIQRALAKAPEERFSTAAEFRDALDAAPPRAVPSPAAEVRAGRAPDAPPPLAALVGRARAAFGRLRVRGAAGSPTLVAVLPFTVRGSERLAYLGEGMVDLLSAKLSGAGQLRCADPRAVLALLSPAERRGVDPQRGRTVAERLGAGRFILGSLIEVGGRLQLAASLYDARGVPRATAQASAAAETQLFDLVDELAIQLLAGVAGEEAAEAPALASSTTHSLDALKAFLAGESAFRAGRFTAAREAFARAVELDPDFALAWYRLSVAAEWTVDRDLEDEAARQALAHGDRLSERDRRLLEAFVAWRRGARGAEGLYRDILASYPNSVEAWFQLGEVLFHYGPLCGRSISESRECWERVLRFEPGSLGALYHLARVAAVERRWDELDALTDRVLALAPQGERALEARALRAFALGDHVEQRRALDELRLTSDAVLLGTMRQVALYAGSPAAALPLSRLLTEPARADEVRALGHAQNAYLEAARGRWRAALAELTAVARLDPARAVEARGHLAGLPFLPLARREVEAARAELDAWDAAPPPPRETASLFVTVHDDLRPLLRAYLLGLLGARLGDAAETHRRAAELRGTAINAGDAGHRALAPTLGDDLHAQVAALRGERAAAIETLGRVVWEVSYVLPLLSPLYSRTHARFLHASLLADQGEAEHAARLLGSFGEVSVYDLVYLAPAHLRRARLHDAAGDAERAGGDYRRVVELWSDCDAELRPAVQEAERRLAALGASAAGLALTPRSGELATRRPPPPEPPRVPPIA